MKSDWKSLRHSLTLLGIGLAAAGYVRYSTQGENTHLTEGLMIGGGVLFVIGAALSYKEIAGLFRTRSSRLGANTLTLTVLVLVVLGLLNFLSFRHHTSVDVTTEKLYTLSDQSRHVSAGLKQDVDILRFSKTPDPDFKYIMSEYSHAGPHIHYRDVDPQEHPEVARQYNITRMNQVVVASGKQNQILDGTTEQDITNALMKVTRDTVKTVYFVEGHQERSTASTDTDGFSGVATDLKNEGYTVSTVNLLSAGSVPMDCSVLVVAGPKKSFFPQEAQMIAKYLDGGGKALFLLDPETDPKLDDVLQSWNIQLGNNVVVDISQMNQLLGTGAAAALVIDYGTSPITQNFSRTMTIFPLARTVGEANKNQTQPEAIDLLKTSDRSFTIPKLVQEVHFDPKTDTPGPLTLGISAEKDSDPAGGDAGNAKNARLVVIGNSAFADNEWADKVGNGDLFMNTVNWLAQDESFISIRPKSPTNRHVVLTATQQRELNLVSEFFVPGLVMLTGGFIWLKRR